MRTFVGIGKGETASAVDSAVNGLVSPSMILFITPYEAVEETASMIYERFPDVPSIGTVGTKVANGVVEEQEIVVLGLYEDAKVSCGVICNLSSCPVVSVKELEGKILEVSPGQDNTVCIEFCTGYEERLVTTFHACLETKGIQLAGGTVFGVPEGKEAVVAYNGRLYEDSCVYAIIKNTVGKVKVFKENIYKKSSQISHVATKVDVNSKTLLELDGKPAAAVYSQELNVSKEKIIDNVLKNPMGRVVGEQVFISSMKSLKNNGALENFKRINKNDCIYFLELGDYREIEAETRNMICEEMKGISLVLSVDCIYRYLLYEQENYFTTYAKDMASLGTHIGVVTGGEQFNNQHVNQTMVCAVFE